MGIRTQQPLLILLAAALLSVPSLAQDDEVKKEQPDAQVVREATIVALKDLAAAYSSKRRTAFMKLVSDDFSGDLGTLEDALSSDFRAYRAISLSIIPRNVEVKGDRAGVNFRFDMTAADDRGQNRKFGGQAAYTFVYEKGKAKLLRMDRTPIFGTSLSSVENPVPKSQGAAPQEQTTQAPGCNTTTVSGSGSFDSDAMQGFRFDTHSTVPQASADIRQGAGPTLLTNAPATIAEMGPCNLSGVTAPPATVNDSVVPLEVGSCYAVRTAADKFAVFKVVSFASNVTTIQFKFQPSGARCF
jgi:hypothetical protein